MTKPNIKIILSSIRPNRAGQTVADWVKAQVQNRSDATFELVDLKDHQLPMFASEGFPSQVTDGDYGSPAVNNWAKKIGEADGFVFITPEYNHGYSSVLKNNIDHIYAEWNNKAAGFISYGSIAGGSRAVEQLRQVAGELQIADVRTAVHIPNIWAAFDDSGQLLDEQAGQPLHTMLDQVIGWAGALQTVRQKSTTDTTVKATQKEPAEVA